MNYYARKKRIKKNKDKEYDLFATILSETQFLHHRHSIETIQQYLELDPSYNWSCIGAYVNSCKMDLNAVETIRYWIRVLTAAIGAKSINIIRYFNDIWNEDNRQAWLDLNDDIIVSYVIQMDLLLESTK